MIAKRVGIDNFSLHFTYRYIDTYMVLVVNAMTSKV